MTKAAKKNSALDDIFAAYARTSPLEDLRFTLRGVRTHVSVYDVSDRTLELARQMVALEAKLAEQLATTGSTSNQKALVAHLIACYKSSIPGFAGAAGADGSWAKDIPEWSWRYACQGTRVVDITIQPPPEDPTMPPLRLKPQHVGVVMTRYEGNPWEKRAAHRLAEENQDREKRAADALHHFRVPMRLQPLDVEAVSALLGAPAATEAIVEAKPKPARKMAKVSAPGCPSCHATLVVVDAQSWTCPPCQKTWQMVLVTPGTQKVAKARAPRTPRPDVVRAPRVAAVVDEHGRRQCVSCSTWQAEDQFNWGDGGRTIRKMCRTCRRSQQQAARRATAA